MKKRTRIIVVLLALPLVLIAVALGALFAGEKIFQNYFDRWGAQLVDLEKRGLLSTEFGAAWHDILTGQTMSGTAELLTGKRPASGESQQKVEIVDGVRINDYPSLTLVARLNQITSYSNAIEIVDRNELLIADIRTDHNRAKLQEFPPTLITALIAAEDAGFWQDTHGFAYWSYVRAALRAAQRSVLSFSLSSPRGTSTITQQVAKLFISDLDHEGRRMVQRSIDRKLREMRIAAALRQLYTPQEILEVYLNHCVTSDYGLIGVRDIAEGLFGKELAALSDAQCLYIARMVKWGRNLPGKIIAQCHIDMPRMGEALTWDHAKQEHVLVQLDSLTFLRPQRVATSHGLLVDLANEYWLKTLERAGADQQQLAEMNIIDPNSLIRKKGNLRIRLTIDLPLQKELERLVQARGYGQDTIITTDARVGSRGEDIVRNTPPTDTLRLLQVLDEDRKFTEQASGYSYTVKAGDTLVTNIRYKKTGNNRYRRSTFFYSRSPYRVNGQYFAYAIMDSRSTELLACYSRDQIGSRMASLLRNRTPNGSSTAKPIFNALMFDMGIFSPVQQWSDTILPSVEHPWARTFDYERGKPTGVIFTKSAVKGRGYKVHNYNDIFEGCRFVFDLLATSNNILGAETCYRLDCALFDNEWNVTPQGFAMARLLTRLGAFGRVKDSLKLRTITGVRVYKELARIVGVDIDSMSAYGSRIAVSDSLYSVALGTLELTLLEQMHLFNVLYNNNLVENPAIRPSLYIKSITLDQKPLDIADTVRVFHPFDDVANLRPTWLGMHNRLIGNRWDNLAKFDIPASQDSDSMRPDYFSPDYLQLNGAAANFAKSGTTDDIIRPFNTDPTSKKRTNYGMWNAVIRIDLSRLANKGAPAEITDLTVACIGEGNTAFTGARDGKTLHKFLTQELLLKAGSAVENGYYKQYENYLRRVGGDPSLCSGSKD